MTLLVTATQAAECVWDDVSRHSTHPANGREEKKNDFISHAVLHFHQCLHMSIPVAQTGSTVISPPEPLHIIYTCVNNLHHTWQRANFTLEYMGDHVHIQSRLLRNKIEFLSRLPTTLQSVLCYSCWIHTDGEASLCRICCGSAFHIQRSNEASSGI